MNLDGVYLYVENEIYKWDFFWHLRDIFGCIWDCCCFSRLVSGTSDLKNVPPFYVIDRIMQKKKIPGLFAKFKAKMIYFSGRKAIKLSKRIEFRSETSLNIVIIIMKQCHLLDTSQFEIYTDVCSHVTHARCRLSCQNCRFDI